MASRRQLPRKWREEPFTVRDALAAGVTPDRLRGRDLERPFHGVRVDPVGLVELSRFGDFASARAADEFGRLVARCRAGATRLGSDQFFSHVTAARLWKAPLGSSFGPGEPLDVSVRHPGRAPRARGIAGHQARADAAICDRFGLPVADPASTFIALGRRLDHDDLVAVGDHLVLDPPVLDPADMRPYVTLAGLRERVAGFSGWGAAAAASAIRDVREGVEARTESLLRLLLVRAGLPEPEVGVDIFDRDGRWLGRADMLFRDWRVVTEYDGEQHRTSTTQYHRDETRIENFNRAGYPTVRIRKAHLFGHPEIAVERVTRALRSAGWGG